MSATKHQLNVEITPVGEDPVAFDFTGVQYVSFINGDTFGKPTLIAKEEDGARAAAGSTVLYINPANVAAVSIERVA